MRETTRGYARDSKRVRDNKRHYERETVREGGRERKERDS
jgi:hypothetical protein